MNMKNVIICWKDGFNVYALVLWYTFGQSKFRLIVYYILISAADSPFASIYMLVILYQQLCFIHIIKSYTHINMIINNSSNDHLRFIIYMMNKQLERDLQACIQSLKGTQLANVLTHFQTISDMLCEKNIIKKGMNYQCQVTFRNQATKGYGRTEEESLTNATKNMLSSLVGKNIDIDKITQSLKYKNGLEGTQSKQPLARQQSKQQSLFLDDISMIQANSRLDFYPEISNENKTKDKNSNCDCVYYQMHQYSHNQIKHLQARVNLLTEENMLLKKMLLCGSSRPPLSEISDKESKLNKQNDSYHANSQIYDKIKL